MRPACLPSARRRDLDLLGNQRLQAGAADQAEIGGGMILASSIGVLAELYVEDPMLLVFYRPVIAYRQRNAAQREADRPLQGDISVDDAYLGGERTGGAPGRGSSTKSPLSPRLRCARGGRSECVSTR